MLHDANCNVVGIVRECDNKLVRPFRCGPYGDVEREGLDGTITSIEGFSSAGHVSFTPADFASPQGFQGLWYDADTALYYLWTRGFEPTLQRAIPSGPVTGDVVRVHGTESPIVPIDCEENRVLEPRGGLHDPGRYPIAPAATTGARQVYDPGVTAGLAITNGLSGGSYK